MNVVTLAERPDLAPAVPEVLASRWPAFMLAGRPGHGVDLTKLAMDAPQHQVLLLDPADQVLAVGISTPLDWDFTAEGLPAGWDGAVAAGAELIERGAAPQAVSALSITIRPSAAGQGLAVQMIAALKDAAGRAGARALIAPVRPILKEHYPLIPMSRYVAWRTEDGRAFDPWLRLHLAIGASVLGIASHSMTITGTVAEWREWTELALPDTGAYVIPGGLTPLLVNREADTGRYQEPNVWVAHRVAGGW